MADWQNRIVDTGTVDPATLVPNQRNYRQHPSSQVAALKGALVEVGWVAPVTVNRTTGNLVDGHARAKLAVQNGIKSVPVQYVELSLEDELKVLASLDPIGQLASIDRGILQGLLDDVRTKDAGLQTMLDNLRPPDISAYEPDLFPEFGKSKVTDADVEATAGKLESRFEPQEEVMLENVCPHCGKVFYTVGATKFPEGAKVVKR
jgi:hypothetical protein